MRNFIAMVALVLSAFTVAPAYADEDCSEYSGWADAPQQEDSITLGHAIQRSASQTAALLPSCMSASLSVTPGYNVNCRNGLPPTRLDSFVASSGYDDRIYGVFGNAAAYTSWKTIGDGINESGTATVYGLSTGHRSNLPTLQSDPGVIVRADSSYDSSFDRTSSASGRK